MIQDIIFNEARLSEMIHRHGVRPSAQRIAILGCVANGHRHPSADEIYTRLVPKFPSLSRTTVYNSLHTLTEAGIIRELEIEASNMRYDLGAQQPHSHFICRECGSITDMEMPSGVSSDRLSTGYTIVSVDVYYKGLCPDCTKNQPTT